MKVKDWFLGKIRFFCNTWKNVQNGGSGFQIYWKILSLDFSETVFLLWFLTSILKKVLAWENFSPWIMNQKDLDQ